MWITVGKCNVSKIQTVKTKFEIFSDVNKDWRQEKFAKEILVPHWLDLLTQEGATKM